MSDYLSFPDYQPVSSDLMNLSLLRKKLRFIRDLKNEKLKDIEKDLPDDPETLDYINKIKDPSTIAYCIEHFSYFLNLVTITDETYLQKLFARLGTILFEGAQGVLLDQNFGFQPYTTWSDITSGNADEILQGYSGQITRLGLTRAYATRHGAGPFVTEDQGLTELLPDPHNPFGSWQQQFRVGYLDLMTLRYARDVIGNIDHLVVTCLDQMDKISDWIVCSNYIYCGKEDLNEFFEIQDGKLIRFKVPDHPNYDAQCRLSKILNDCKPQYVILEKDIGNYLSFVEDNIGLDVSITSYGPSYQDKRGREF